MTQHQWSRALVVGASSGIGEAVARTLVQRGVTVALVARRAERLEALCTELNQPASEQRAYAFPFDVRNTSGVSSIFQEIATTLGGLDLVVYAAGVMPRIGLHDYPTEIDKVTIETNLAGAVAWLNEAAARFDVAGAGAIVGISSVAGDRGRRGNTVYSATKAGLNAYLESLRARLATRGVTVLTAKPGYVGTALTEGLVLPRYLPVVPPESVATQILDAAASGKRIAYVPPWWRAIMLLIRSVPAPLFERLSV